jgi:hypothetical protein
MVEQGIKQQTSILNNQSEDYIETDLQLKSSILLNPKASAINPINVSDLVLGTVKDPKIIKQLQFWLEMQITMHQAGMKRTANYYGDLVLTTLNFRRSENGQQQQYIISRINKAKLELQPERASAKDKIKESY